MQSSVSKSPLLLHRKFTEQSGSQLFSCSCVTGPASSSRSDRWTSARKVILNIGTLHKLKNVTRLLTEMVQPKLSCTCSWTVETREEETLDSMPLDLCMVFISDGGVLTARNNCKMSKSCYSSYLMCIAVDISHWCIIYVLQSQSHAVIHINSTIHGCISFETSSEVLNILEGLAISDFSLKVLQLT